MDGRILKVYFDLDNGAMSQTQRIDCVPVKIERGAVAILYSAYL